MADKELMYLLKRVTVETSKALQTNNINARHAHLDMAKAYEDRAVQRHLGLGDMGSA